MKYINALQRLDAVALDDVYKQCYNKLQEPAPDNPNLLGSSSPPSILESLQDDDSRNTRNANEAAEPETTRPDYFDLDGWGLRIYTKKLMEVVPPVSDKKNHDYPCRIFHTAVCHTVSILPTGLYYFSITISFFVLY